MAQAGSKTRKDYENEVRSWGFPHVFTWTDGSYDTTVSNLSIPLLCTPLVC